MSIATVYKNSTVHFKTMSRCCFLGEELESFLEAQTSFEEAFEQFSECVGVAISNQEDLGIKIRFQQELDALTCAVENATDAGSDFAGAVVSSGCNSCSC
jgi:hypothetical protein